MKSETNQKSRFREAVSMISAIISWTIFTLLIICAIFLVYYFIATKIYVKKGTGHEPKFSLYTIVSPSMVPTINVYDVIIDFKVDKPEEIKINDVITFNSSIPGVHGGTITHRVIAISKDAEGNYFYQTKGDNNLIEDGVSVPFNSVVGKVALRIPKLGNIQKFVATKAGWMIVVLIPALYIIVKAILRALKLNQPSSTDGRLKAFLNRPVIGYNKPKLLPYTPHQERIADNYNDIFNDDDEDIDIDDLPQLK